MREIMQILQADAHATPERVATMTGLDPEEVREQIAAWEQSGIIPATRRYSILTGCARPLRPRWLRR